MIEGPADKDSFDLADLGPTRTHLTPFGFMRNGKLEGFEPFVVPTRASDYDEAFLKKLLAIQPVYATTELLSYHFDHFLQKQENGREFLHHLEYVLLPQLKNVTGTAHAVLAQEWLTTQKNLMLSQYKQQRLDFLAAAYKAACTHPSGQPLSIKINPLALGQELNLDRATVSRIVTELVQDGLVNSTLGMGSMQVTRAGVRQLEESESASASLSPTLQQNFHFAHGSIPNIATASGANSVQVTNTGAGAQLNVASGGTVQQMAAGQPAASLPDLIAQLRRAFAAEPKLAAHQEDAEEEFNRLEAQLQRPEPKKSLLSRSFEVLRDLAKDGVGSVAGHAVFELLQQAPHLLGALQA